MQTDTSAKEPSGSKQKWISLPTSISFLLSKKQLLGLSLVLFIATALLTWLGYYLAIDFIDGLAEQFFPDPPNPDNLLAWIKHKGWLLLHWLYLIITRIVAFYLAFLIAYTLTTPGYVLLSTAAEKLYLGEAFEMDEGLSLRGFLLDLIEGLKIAAFGIIVTIIALLVNFIPIIGQLLVVLLYIYYSALMFIDYPASRRRWYLGRKINWLRINPSVSLRLGILPAVVSMVPLLNIFFMAVLFPFLTVQATLNFTEHEHSNHIPSRRP